MRKLELSAASLAEVAANKERNFSRGTAGQSVNSVTDQVDLSTTSYFNQSIYLYLLKFAIK